MTDQAGRLREMVASAPRPMPGRVRRGARGTRSIAVTSGKGGVGKTNVALMLSVALADLGKKVLLLDADLGLANVHILLGLAPKRNLSDVAAGRCAAADIVCEGPRGIGIVPGASGAELLARMDSAGLETLQRKMAPLEEGYDFLVVDTSAGIGSVATRFASATDSALVVMSPEPTALADAYAMIKVLSGAPEMRLWTLVNMAASDNEGAEAFDKLHSLVVQFLHRDVRLMGILPFDREIPRLIRRQKLVLTEHPRHIVSSRINGCARRLCGLPPRNDKGFFARFFGKTG